MKQAVKPYIVHARSQFLKAFSPKGKRDIPPLRYERGYINSKAISSLEDHHQMAA